MAALRAQTRHRAENPAGCFAGSPSSVSHAGTSRNPAVTEGTRTARGGAQLFRQGAREGGFAGAAIADHDHAFRAAHSAVGVDAGFLYPRVHAPIAVKHARIEVP